MSCDATCSYECDMGASEGYADWFVVLICVNESISSSLGGLAADGNLPEKF
jgi:hypothetical protein